MRARMRTTMRTAWDGARCSTGHAVAAAAFVAVVVSLVPCTEGGHRAVNLAPEWAAVAEQLPCNVDRWKVCPKRRKIKKGSKKDCLSEADFNKNYLHKEPVIISGFTKDWAAMKHWTGREAFVKRHGGVFVGVKDAGDLILGGPGTVSAHIPMNLAGPLLADDPDLFVFDRLDQGVSSTLLPDFITRAPPAAQRSAFLMSSAAH